MKALTVWQPWASLIVAGLKPYEFRRWPAPGALVGQRIAIHAGGRPVRRGEVADLILRLGGPEAWTTALRPAGAGAGRAGVLGMGRDARGERRMSVTVHGVVAFLLDDAGRVVGSASDFEMSGYGGFELHEAQRIRARAAMCSDYVRGACNGCISAVLNRHECERIVRSLVDKAGFREAFILIGHDTVDARFGYDFVAHHRAAPEPSL